MSYVTNAILIYDTANDDHYLEDVNTGIDSVSHGGGFVSTDSFDDGNWVGGTKHLEIGVALAAFNYLNEDALLAHLRSLPVSPPFSVYLVLKSETDDFPRFIYIGGAA